MLQADNGKLSSLCYQRPSDLCLCEWVGAMSTSRQAVMFYGRGIKGRRGSCFVAGKAVWFLVETCHAWALLTWFSWINTTQSSSSSSSLFQATRPIAQNTIKTVRTHTKTDNWNPQLLCLSLLTLHSNRNLLIADNVQLRSNKLELTWRFVTLCISTSLENNDDDGTCARCPVICCHIYLLLRQHTRSVSVFCLRHKK